MVFQKKREMNFKKGVVNIVNGHRHFKLEETWIKRGEKVTGGALRILSVVLWAEIKVQEMKTRTLYSIDKS